MNAPAIDPAKTSQTPPPEKPTESREELKKRMQEDGLRRSQMAIEEVNTILEKYKCIIMARPILTDDGRLSADVTIRSV